MHIKSETLDDLLQSVFARILKSKTITNSSNGRARELMAVMLTLKNPRARFSATEKRATLLSCLGETLWYFSGSNDLEHIEHYIPSYRKILKLPEGDAIAPGGYGPRIFGSGDNGSQLTRVIKHLREKKDTRQAVIQIFDAADLGKLDVPCTCTLQFMARGGHLHMLTTMRSNDAYLGLSHDVFAFTWLQEVVARSIAAEVGLYHHTVGSLHLYEKDEAAAREYLNEGWQPKIAMPSMPKGDPWPSIEWLLKVESSLRIGDVRASKKDGVEQYWADIAGLLKVHALLKENKLSKVAKLRQLIEVKNGMSSEVYRNFVRSKSRAKNINLDSPPSEDLFKP